MKEKFIKWMSFLALASFVAAVFMIADGYFWPGIAFMVAGTVLSSAAAIYKKKNTDSVEDKKTN